MNPTLKPQLPNHVESTLNKSSFERTTILPLKQEDNIADEFEEFLEHFGDIVFILVYYAHKCCFFLAFFSNHKS